MTIGIYKITNNISGKSYIGQSVHIEQRISEHKSESASTDTNRKAYNSVIHKAIRKYGWSNFSYSIIEECLISELDDKERFWIKEYNTLIPNGYNILVGGQQYRKDLDVEVKKKNVCPFCGRPKDKNASMCRKCWDSQRCGRADDILKEQGKDSIIIAILNSSYESVAKSLGFTSSNGLKRAMKKFGWPCTKREMFDYYYCQNNQYHPKDRRSRKKYQWVYQIDANTHRVVDKFCLSPENCKQKDLHSGHVIECCKGIRQKYKGFMFRFISQPIRIACIDIKTNEVVQRFNSLKDAARWCQKNDFSQNSSIDRIAQQIRAVCFHTEENRHTAFGYSWCVL